MIRNATLIDAASPARADHAVVIANGRIAAVAPSSRLAIPPGARVIDAGGGFLIPGLWDMHAHVAGYPAALGLLVAHGVTGVRDMGNATPEQSREIEEWRRDIGEGRRVGPRLVAPGPTLDGTRGFESAGRLFVSGPADAPGALATIRARGAAFAKVHDWLSRESYAALIAAAREAGLRVAGHTPVAVPALDVAGAGQASIEHLGGALGGILLDASSREDALRRELLTRMQQAREARSESGLWQWAMTSARFEGLLESWDGAKASALVDAFERNGTWHCPTLVVLSPTPRPRGAEAGRFVYASAAAACASGGREPAAASGASTRARVFARRLAFVADLQRAGVGLLVGSDFIRPDREAIEEFETCDVPLAGLSVHEELEWLVEAGLRPVEALAAATRGPALFFGEPDAAGIVAPGQRADLVLLDANPLEDIRNARRVRSVTLAGRLLERGALDALLADAEADARGH